MRIRLVLVLIIMLMCTTDVSAADTNFTLHQAPAILKDPFLTRADTSEIPNCQYWYLLNDDTLLIVHYDYRSSKEITTPPACLYSLANHETIPLSIREEDISHWVKSAPREEYLFNYLITSFELNDLTAATSAITAEHIFPIYSEIDTRLVQCSTSSGKRFFVDTQTGVLYPRQVVTGQLTPWGQLLQMNRLLDLSGNEAASANLSEGYSQVLANGIIHTKVAVAGSSIPVESFLITLLNKEMETIYEFSTHGGEYGRFCQAWYQSAMNDRLLCQVVDSTAIMLVDPHEDFCQLLTFSDAALSRFPYDGTSEALTLLPTNRKSIRIVGMSNDGSMALLAIENELYRFDMQSLTLTKQMSKDDLSNLLGNKNGNYDLLTLIWTGGEYLQYDYYTDILFQLQDR